MNTKSNYAATVFLSCSLRKEDKTFVDWVVQILRLSNVHPFGTIGKYASYSESPAISMRNNIQQADFTVIAATKRYFVEDVHYSTKANSLSEMIHTEAGMSFALGKPVVVFVEKGVEVGSFLPLITQYITLDLAETNLNDEQRWKIYSLLSDARRKSLENKRRAANKEISNLIGGVLAVIGAVKLLED